MVEDDVRGMVAEDQSRKLAIERLKNRRGFWPDLLSYVVVNSFLVLAWALSGAGYFWPGWVMGAWGIGLVMHAWTAFFQRPITEQDIQDELKRGGPAVA